MEYKKHLFEVLAEERNCTVEDIRKMISVRIEIGLCNADSQKRKEWEAIPCKGEIPTPEEWLEYAIGRLIEDGEDDLLKWYPRPRS